MRYTILGVYFPRYRLTLTSGKHSYTGHEIYVSVQRGVNLQRSGETRGSNQFPSITSLLPGNLLTLKTATENSYPHKFDHDDSKGNKLTFPDYCPENDENRQEFPLVSPPPYDGGKNNVKQGDERVVYYWKPGDIDYSDNPNVLYCGIMTHDGAPTGGFKMCS